MSYVRAVEVLRGGIVESLHHGAAVVSDADGGIVARLGDPAAVTFPRSSLKALQALPLVESGAADAFGLAPEHIALAAASHAAEPFHVALVSEWLARIGLADDALACGPAWPRNEADRDALLARGGRPKRRFNNCSGKHAGMLTVCVHGGLPVDGYARLSHPLQQEILGIVGALAGRPLSAADVGVDGCDLPSIALSMAEMALAIARFSARQTDVPGRAEAMARILDAMRRHPAHVSGTGTPTVAIAEATEGRVLVKTGAEGYAVAFLPAEGLGVALKTADGADRARWVILIELLDRAGLLSRAEAERLASLRHPAVLNSVGREVGVVRPALDGLVVEEGGGGAPQALI